MQVGEVSELWRYPVKSMRGDRVSSAVVTDKWGVPGDRGWAVRDEQASEIRGAKWINSLLQFHARYLDEPVADSTPGIEITFPDGSTMRSSDGRIDEALSAAAGREVTLWPRRPADDHEHYRRGRITEVDIREQLDLGPDDPFPDFSTLPEDVLAELFDYVTPRGTYFDAMPLSLATTSALGALQGAVPDSVIDPRRFRKNIIVSTGSGSGGFPEFDWVGRRLQLGEVTCEVTVRIPRCVMVNLPQAELPHDGSVLKTLAARTGMDFGVYLRVIEPGRISEGDEVHLH